MPYANCKIYSDGSHYIAIPHTTRPYKPRRKPKEEVITVSEESTELQGQAENSAPSLGDAPIPLDKNNHEDRETEQADSGSEKEDTSVEKQGRERRMTRKELFEELYEKNINLSRRQRRKAVLNGMRPYFKSEEALQNYVTAQFERKLRNLIARRHCDRRAQRAHLHTALQTIRIVHCDRTDGVLADMLLDLDNQFLSVGACNLKGVENFRQHLLCFLSFRIKSNVDNGADDLGNMSYYLCHIMQDLSNG